MRFAAFVALAVLALSWPSHAADWLQWRGPNFNGSSPETNLPKAFSKTNKVLWTAPLPGPAGATPIISGKSVFLTTPDDARNLLLLRINADTGAEVWRKNVDAGDRDKGRNNMASPSPVTDGKTVVAMFGTGRVSAFDFSGKQLWTRDLAKEYGSFANMWIYGASPLLLDGRVYIQVLQRSPVPSDYTHASAGGAARESYLLCLALATGTNLWRHLRVTAAEGESMESYATPIPRTIAGKTEILVFGANNLTAHDPQTGAELWRSPDLNPTKEPHWRVVPSPLPIGGTIIVCGPRGAPVYALRPNGSGQLPPESVLWSYKEQPSDCCTPLAYDKKLFVLNGDRQVLTRLDPESGRVLWQGNLGVREIFRASPLGADGRIFCLSESGTLVILDPGDQFRIIDTIPFGEAPVRSSIVAAGQRLYVRTAKHLYCVADK